MSKSHQRVAGLVVNAAVGNWPASVQVSARSYTDDDVESL